MSSARNAGESAICPVPAPPSAEIARVECAKCRRERDLSGARGNSLRIVRVERAKLRASAGEFVVQTLVRGVSGELADENW